MNHLLFIISVSLLLPACSEKEPVPSEPVVVTTARYFDASGGNDENNGLTPSSAWKSLDTISSLIWGAGGEILLKKGETWSGQILLKGIGTENKPVRLSSYGDGPKPIINGNGSGYVIRLDSTEYWEISDIEITNYGVSEETRSLEAWESYNITHWSAGIALPPMTEPRKEKYGILLTAIDRGEVSGHHFINLEIHGINGNINSKDNSAIFMEITGTLKPTWFDDILIEGCYIHDIDRTGISNQSTWSNRSATTNTNWKPSTGIIIRNNRFERTGANALIVRVAESPLIEYNLFDHCAIKESGNACFSFNCDNAVWQYNEARYTKYNEGDADAGGFDSDYRCKNTVIRYNYSHHNEYGAVLVCCQGGDTRFNIGTLIYYNLFVNNLDHAIRVSGTPDNTTFFNNVIFSSGSSLTDVIWHKSWSGYPSNTRYVNNIFYLPVSAGNIELGSSTFNTFEKNVFFGNYTGDVPSSRFTFNPLFSGGNLTGDPAPEMFKLSDGSPAIDAGMSLTVKPSKDYFGNTITGATNPDLGIHEKK